VIEASITFFFPPLQHLETGRYLAVSLGIVPERATKRKTTDQRSSRDLSQSQLVTF